MFRSKAALLDDLADLTVQYHGVMAELLAERRRADRAEGNLARLAADMRKYADERTYASVARGLAQSAAGEVCDLGDFTQYLDAVFQAGKHTNADERASTEGKTA